MVVLLSVSGYLGNFLKTQIVFVRLFEWKYYVNKIFFQAALSRQFVCLNSPLQSLFWQDEGLPFQSFGIVQKNAATTEASTQAFPFTKATSSGSSIHLFSINFCLKYQ